MRWESQNWYYLLWLQRRREGQSTCATHFWAALVTSFLVSSLKREIYISVCVCVCVCGGGGSWNGIHEKKSKLIVWLTSLGQARVSCTLAELHLQHVHVLACLFGPTTCHNTFQWRLRMSNMQPRARMKGYHSVTVKETRSKDDSSSSIHGNLILLHVCQLPQLDRQGRLFIGSRNYNLRHGDLTHCKGHGWMMLTNGSEYTMKMSSAWVRSTMLVSHFW